MHRKSLLVGVLLHAVILASACGNHRLPSRSWPPPRAGYQNPIPAENELAGDPAWSAGTDPKGHQLEAYGDRISVKAGETIGIHASTDIPATARWVLYRFGWYGGSGARIVRTGGPVPLGPQPACPVQPVTGLVRCAWSTTMALDITAGEVSGLYAVKLVRDDGRVSFVPFVVIDDRSADLLVQASVQTYAAYNVWGGTSLYRDTTGTLARGFASKVSFDRPFDAGRGLGQMIQWELPMAWFLERHGYDVTYATNVDVGTGNASFVERAGMFLSVGHDEYWAGGERDSVERARDDGVPLGFFSSNTSYWKVRYEDFRDAGSPRTIVCYKDGDDPLGPAESGMFRGNGIRRPENALVGVMYDSWQLAPFPLLVTDPGAWLYTGTGLRSNDLIAGVVGYEFDRRYANGAEPSGVETLARSPVVSTFGKPGWAETVAYRAESGAFIFASGSIYWSRGLDQRIGIDSRVERMTANVFHEALGLPIPQALQSISPPDTATSRMGPLPVIVDTLVAGIPGAAGVAVLPGKGGIVVSTTQSPRVLIVDAISNTATILAGDGQSSTDPSYDDVPGARARFDSPVGVAVDAAGHVYVVDSAASVIRRIDSDIAHTVTTFAGKLGAIGNADGIGKAARFSYPDGIAIDPSGSTLYIADTANHRIRAVDVVSRTVTTVAGSSLGDLDGPGRTARFNYPTGVAIAPDGRIFVLSTASQKVKAILPDAVRTVVTLAGSGEGYLDGAGSVARLAPQSGVAWAGTFLAFSDGPALRVRALVPGTKAATSEVYTLAFSGRFGSSNGPATDATIGPPVGLAAADGAVYVADGANGTIRVIRRGR
jgi:hypothetical protein